MLMRRILGEIPNNSISLYKPRKRAKLYAFFFHFNKPASKAKGKPQISVHMQSVCHIVDNVVCNVRTKGRLNKRQPRFVMVGKAKSFKIVDGIGILE